MLSNAYKYNINGALGLDIRNFCSHSYLFLTLPEQLKNSNTGDYTIIKSYSIICNYTFESDAKMENDSGTGTIFEVSPLLPSI